MLEHLLDFDGEGFTDAAKTDPQALLSAQIKTTSLLDAFDDGQSKRVTDKAQQEVARRTFLALTTNQDPDAQRLALMNLQVPDAVKQLVGMLTAYDWAFVEQAKELRGYAVAKIVEEIEHPDARIRLKALELLGKVTEVALFTERSEVKHVGMSDAELDEELKQRLAKYIELKEASGTPKLEEKAPA